MRLSFPTPAYSHPSCWFLQNRVAWCSLKLFVLFAPASHKSAYTSLALSQKLVRWGTWLKICSHLTCWVSQNWSCTVLTSSVPTYFSDFADQCLVKLSWQLFVPYRHRIQWNQNISADIRPNWDTHVKYIHFACFVFAQNCHWFKNITSKVGNM